MSASVHPPEEYKELLLYVAKVVYQSIVAYERAIGIDESLDWDDIDEVSKGEWAMVVDSRMGSVMTAEQDHSVTMEVKRKEGWQFGESYSEELKLDPYLVPFESLPERVKVERYLINTLVKALTQ